MLGKGGSFLYISSDTKAIRVLKSIADFNITYNNSEGVQLHFTSVTDAALLQAITDNKTEIRAQILVHRQNHSMPSLGTGGSVYIEESKFPVGIGLGDYAKDVKTMSRPMATHNSAEGIYWISLSATQLRNGSATINFKKFNVNRQGCSTSNDSEPYFEFPDAYIAVELYVPAFGPGTSNQFQYINEKGAHKISPIIAI